MMKVILAIGGNVLQPIAISRSSKAAPMKLLVSERHAIFRAGLQVLLQSASLVVDTCQEARHIIAANRRLKPDLIILDSNIVGSDAAKYANVLKANNLDTHIILSLELATFLANAELATNIDGFLLKSSTAERLFNCIKIVASGERWVDPGLLDVVSCSKLRSAGVVLTAREAEIAEHVARGFRNKQIARSLRVSEATVKMHLHHVYGKLHLGGRAELASAAQLTRCKLNADGDKGGIAANAFKTSVRNARLEAEVAALQQFRVQDVSAESLLTNSAATSDRLPDAALSSGLGRKVG
jgi:two-component system nitrate/nitrite response regulator NarL